MQDQHSQPLPPNNQQLPPIRIDMESLYMLFDEMTVDQLKDLVEDIRQEIDIRKYEDRRVALARQQADAEKYKLRKELEEEEKRYAKEKAKFAEEFEREKERVRMGLVKQTNKVEDDLSSYTVEDFSSESPLEEEVEDEGESTANESDYDEVVEESTEEKPKPKPKPQPVVKAKAKAKAKAKKVEIVEEEPKKRTPIKRNKKKSN